MLVCHCLRVNDRTVRLAIRSGARSCERIADACGAGSECGGCRPVIDILIEDERCADESLPTAAE